MLLIGGKTRELQEQINALHKELGPLVVDQERVLAELGVSRAADVISLVRSLQRRVAELEPLEAPLGLDDSMQGLNDPRAVMLKIRQFNGKIESMNESVASMEEQLSSLYADKEVLEKEIGASEVEDVINAFRQLEATITAMESQLITLYAGREHFEVELGDSDPQRLVKTVKSIARLVRSLDQELGSTVFDRIAEENVSGARSFATFNTGNGYARQGV